MSNEKIKLIKCSITYVTKLFKRFFPFKNIKGKQTVSLADPAILDKILFEDRELLERLAR